ncbi:NnrU family protein [Aquibaculum arenosum]|uniref:NnrU family protein n=1 Tax=Aquibaculum arenosum TaxID=3032591 RepID=A0ABT5YJE7_9PROT|nr:NnrU family protein [Fodinicurvata sp. CAU 1616]MDF2095072.1 NnrU family protein [Fodinicurvata sp. CAU 1616]
MSASLHLLAAVLLVLGHAVPSAPGLRESLIARLGRSGFMVLHSLVSLATLGFIAWTYWQVDSIVMLFWPPPELRLLVLLLMPLAFLLIAGRLATPFGDLRQPPPPRGIYRLCRFPGSLGLLLWATLHILSTGDSARVTLFGAMAAIALWAMIKNERVLRRAAAPEAVRFLSGTSLLPGLAILSGRQHWPRSEIGWRWPLLAMAAYLLVLFLHPFVFGVDPLQGALSWP